ncbi:GDSL-type esterase/lipase family protein [Modestobacter sp. VKM Ac-2983]|uniref:SGNH/GDSL hydrolase family protein n=1 Tax=Modestobacter sp. VKM Ac-2983 TaxID=3004137 RepID=UPI0022AB6243|nr:GDSL-type esterase/lipase family protein [Modestobacter sp. VKM Ac-2983]MCZ2803691.1 GDSL-type esterase/lipase family protein [Modestobacter sp. VKM Ac-2983]
MRLRTAVSTSGLAVLLLISGCTSSGDDGNQDDTAGSTAAPGQSGGPADEGTTPSDGSAPVLLALGDSISVGFGACGEATACPEASWVTGEDPAVDSIRARLAEAWGVTDVPTSNFARPGAMAADLAGQAQRIVPTDGEGLVTVLVGSNDVCTGSVAAMTSPEEFRAAIDQVLQTVGERAPGAVTVLASVPGVASIYASFRGDSQARDAWAATRVCRSLTGSASGSPEADGERVAAVQERVDQLNEQLAAACAAVDNCVYDAGAVHDWLPEPDDLSDVDAFHPSTTGQAELAEAVWDAAAGTQQMDALAP